MKARQRRRAVTMADISNIGLAILRLRDARTLLRVAGANNAATYVRHALKSAEGAERNACGKYARQEREARHAAR